MDVEFMEQCDIMKQEMTVHLDRLTVRYECLANITVVFASNTTKEHQLDLDTSRGDKNVTFRNPFLAKNLEKSGILSLYHKFVPSEHKFAKF